MAKVTKIDKVITDTMPANMRSVLTRDVRVTGKISTLLRNKFLRLSDVTLGAWRIAIRGTLLANSLGMPDMIASLEESITDYMERVRSSNLLQDKYRKLFEIAFNRALCSVG
jgi:hypothetical protein